MMTQMTRMIRLTWMTRMTWKTWMTQITGNFADDWPYGIFLYDVSINHILHDLNVTFDAWVKQYEAFIFDSCIWEFEHIN